MRIFIASLLCLGFVVLVANPTTAKTILVEPDKGCGQTDRFMAAANSLRPGDELVLAAGVFCQTGRRLITVSGTAEQPIVIRGAGRDKTVVTRPGSPVQGYRFEGTEFRGANLIIRGIHFRGGKRGLVFHAGAHHVTLEDSEVSDTSNNGVTLNNGDTSHFAIRRNEIHHTGNLDPKRGGTEGEGIYVGCNWAKCIAHSHVIEENHIHHLKANGTGGNDGIEIKYGSYGNVVRNNVIHNIAPAFENTKYPCIFAYGTLPRHRDRPNLIEGNTMWDCGEAIQVVSDAIVRGNTIKDSQQALAVYYHIQVPVQRNLKIVNNVIVGSPLRLEFGVQANSDKPDVVLKPPPEGVLFAGNAVYGPNLSPLITIDLPRGGGVVIRDNRTDAKDGPRLVVKRDPAGLVRSGSFVHTEDL